VICRYRPRFTLDREILREGFSFGKYMLLVGILTYITTQFDHVVVGRWLGTTTLGVYVLAYRLATLPMEMVGAVLGSVMTPLYARVFREKPEALGQVLVLAMNGTVSVLVVILIPLAIVADQTVHLLYGSQWEAAAPFVRMLVAVGMFRGIARVVGPIFIGVRRPELDARTKIVEVAVFVPAVLLLVPTYGGAGAAIAGGSSYFLGALIRVILAVRMVQNDRTAVIASMMKPVLSTATAAVSAAVAAASGAPAVVTCGGICARVQHGFAGVRRAAAA
jgi:O-antigen/teichoic acid export membrane protein